MAALKKAPSHGAADLLELEHVIGYTGRHKNVLSQHPSHDSGFLYGLGANVTLADVTDPHEQIFLRGHTADVSAIDISASARLIASGQSRAPTVSVLYLPSSKCPSLYLRYARPLTPLCVMPSPFNVMLHAACSLLLGRRP